MLPNFLPIPVRVDLLALPDVPEEDDYGCDDCDYGTQALVVPLHVVEEEADSLTIARSVVLAVEEFLG